MAKKKKTPISELFTPPPKVEAPPAPPQPTQVSPPPEQPKITDADREAIAKNLPTGTIIDPYGNVRKATDVKTARTEIERIKALSSGKPSAAQALEIKKQQQIQSEQLQSQLGQIQYDQFGNIIAPGAGEGIPIDYKQVALSNVPNIITRGLTGAVAGAVVGAPTGVGAPIGAIAGFVAGVVSGVFSNINSQKADNIGAQKLILTEGQRNLNYFAMLAQVDQANADKYIDGFNQQLSNIAEAYSNLQADTRSNLNLMVAQDGTRELQRFANFYATGGGYEYYTQKMRYAITNPNAQQALIELSAIQQSIGEE